MADRYEVVALGELLIDFTQAGVSDSGMRLFEQNPGGAPANLLTAVSHMGHSTAFVGKVGNDSQGLFLKDTLEKEGICTDYLICDKDTFTTLAFVQIDANGEREFAFARKPGADTRLREDELDSSVFANCKVFHFGSLSLTDEPAATATLKALSYAKQGKAVISYDPNYRKSLWMDEKTAINTIKSVISQVDIMKVSDEESLMITGASTVEEAADKLLKMGPKVIAITLGGKGAFVVTSKGKEIVGGFATDTVDTTGAGDSFWGGFLSRFLTYDKAVEEVTFEEWKECAIYGNATASICVGRRGGIPAIPMLSEVKDKVNGR